MGAAESARCLEISESCNPIDELAKVGRSTLREGVGVEVPRLKHLVFVTYNSLIRLICADNRALENRDHSRRMDVDHHNDRDSEVLVRRVSEKLVTEVFFSWKLGIYERQVMRMYRCNSFAADWASCSKADVALARRSSSTQLTPFRAYAFSSRCKFSWLTGQIMVDFCLLALS